jgi:hypothetical protein
VSDLHCPARFTLATDREVDLAALRPAAVYASTRAEEIAKLLGTRYDVLDAPLRIALETLADQHRGEDVLVLVTTVELDGLPRLSGRKTPLKLEIDADGWVEQA